MLTGGMALFWQPGLEATQNSTTSSMDISGQPVSLIWLFLQVDPIIRTAVRLK